MRILIAEDDLSSRKFLQKFLSRYGKCDLVVDGFETIEAFIIAMKDNDPYNLVCLDIMMPKVDGVKALKAIRDWETRNGLLPEKRAKVVITTALSEGKYLYNAFDIGCDGYLQKPIDTKIMSEMLLKLGIKKIE